MTVSMGKGLFLLSERGRCIDYYRLAGVLRPGTRETRPPRRPWHSVERTGNDPKRP